MFGEIYEDVYGSVDPIAESMLKLGADAISSLTEMQAARTTTDKVVLERERAVDDAKFIRTLVDARTLGHIRGGSQRALDAVREQYDPVEADNEPDDDFDALPDDTEFSVVTWFGYDYWHMVMPLARLITEETVPPDVLRAFGQEDWSMGMDYERATWLQPEDSKAIVAALRGLNHDVDDGPTAQAILNDFDFGNAR